MENCLKLHFFEVTFSVIWIRQKMGFNLIQRKTCCKISADSALHYWKMINCTKFRAWKTQNFKIKSFEIVCEIIVLFLTRPRSLQSSHVCLFKQYQPLLDKFIPNLRQKTDRKLLKNAFFWSRVFHDLK